jgi:class 3 adenylate cyclase
MQDAGTSTLLAPTQHATAAAGAAESRRATPDAVAAVGDRSLRLAQRLGDPSAWSEAGKVRFTASVFIVATGWFSLHGLYALRQPSFEPYVEPAALALLLRLQAAALIAWAIICLWTLVPRRRPGPMPGLLTVTASVLTVQLAVTAYFVGALTDPFAGVTIIAVWAAGLILFRQGPILVGLCAWWGCLLVTTAAAQLGVLPYAPLYRAAPFESGQLHASWLIGRGALILVSLLFVQAVFYVIIRRWQEREGALALTSRQLAQANDVISRYVASQLAEQIRLGNYAALERQERRRLTLFFSDIQEFAAIADAVEPEDLSRQLNEYLTAMTAIAESYGATIDKFVGDAIMIFFGAPAATDDRDQALRAVRMAVDMQRRLHELRGDWLSAGAATAFRVRMGINTGQASVGAFGSPSRVEYTAIGRQVNLAARLQAQCDPDRILISHATYTLVRDEIRCTAKGDIALKGFQRPVPVYEVDPLA